MKPHLIASSHLETLIAVVDEGTFDEAGLRLGISTSAVSQRIRTLEASLGLILLTRTNPVRPTPEGTVLLRLAREQSLLASEALRELRSATEAEDARTPVTLAINEDSLVTWFPAVLRSLAREKSIRLRVRNANETQTIRLLKDASAMAAISTTATAITGCSVRSLGTITYEPRVSRDLLAGDAPIPSVNFDEFDTLQEQSAMGTPHEISTATHLIPGHPTYERAIEAGLGWGMVPVGMAPEGTVRLPHARVIDVALYWHRWNLGSQTLDLLEDEIFAAFGTHPACTPANSRS